MHPFAKEALTLHLARSEGNEHYFECNLMYHKVLTSSHQHLMAEAPHGVYSGAPSTTYQAYKKAQKALQQLGEMTFSDAEIDALLPSDLRKSANPGGGSD